MPSFTCRQREPLLFPHLDVYAQDRDHTVVAGCAGLVDYTNNYAEIEVVCTHTQYRGRGLAKAVIAECMRRLRKEGLTFAYISGSSEATVNLYAQFESSSCRKMYEFKLK